MFEFIGDFFAYGVLGLSADGRAGPAVQFFFADVVKIMVLLVAVVYAMGLLRAFVSPERVREYLRGRSRAGARVMAVFLGAVTPFCSCSSVPLFIGFVEAGIPIGVTFSFLIASPMINEVAVVLLAGVVGWKITLLYAATGLFVAYVGGILMERFRAERWVEEYVWKIHMGEAALPERDTSLRGRHAFAWQEVREIVGRIWKWVILGVAVGAFFHGFVPTEWAAQLGDRWYSVPLAVLVGVPLYSNAVGVIPVAEAMLLKGVALGTTLAFMMSIAALSLPEMIILRKVIKWPGLALFAGMLTVAFILVGWIFNGFAADLLPAAGLAR